MPAKVAKSVKTTRTAKSVRSAKSARSSNLAKNSKKKTKKTIRLVDSKSKSFSERKFSRRKPSIPKVIAVATAVVLFWRGAWGLMDIYLFPEHPPLSFVCSLLIGLAILYATRYLEKELL